MSKIIISFDQDDDLMGALRRWFKQYGEIDFRGVGTAEELKGQLESLRAGDEVAISIPGRFPGAKAARIIVEAVPPDVLVKQVAVFTGSPSGEVDLETVRQILGETAAVVLVQKPGIKELSGLLRETLGLL